MFDNPILTLLVFGIGLVILMYLGSVLLKWFFGKLLGSQPRKSGIKRFDERVDDFLVVMGQRMDRPWMLEELVQVTGENEGPVRALLSRARRRRLVTSEWMTHPVTEADFEGFMLTPKGVRDFGAYAPDDRVTVRSTQAAYQKPDFTTDPAEEDYDEPYPEQEPEEDEEHASPLSPTPLPRARPRGIQRRVR